MASAEESAWKPPGMGCPGCEARKRLYGKGIHRDEDMRRERKHDSDW